MSLSRIFCAEFSIIEKIDVKYSVSLIYYTRIVKNIEYPTTSKDSGLLAFRKDSVIDITDPMTTIKVAYRTLRIVVTLFLKTTLVD